MFDLLREAYCSRPIKGGLLWWCRGGAPPIQGGMLL